MLWISGFLSLPQNSHRPRGPKTISPRAGSSALHEDGFPGPGCSPSSSLLASVAPAFLSNWLLFCSQITPTNHFTRLHKTSLPCHSSGLGQPKLLVACSGGPSPPLQAYLWSVLSLTFYIPTWWNHKPSFLASGPWSFRCVLLYQLLENRRII